MGCVVSSSVVSPADAVDKERRTSQLLFSSAGNKNTSSRLYLCTNTTSCNYDDDSTDIISALEKNHHKVKDIFISYGFLDGLTDDQADLFFQSILKLPMLQTVSMMGEEKSTSLIASEGLAKALGTNDTLKRLKLAGNYMDDYNNNDKETTTKAFPDHTLSVSAVEQQQKKTKSRCPKMKDKYCTNGINDENNFESSIDHRCEAVRKSRRLAAISHALCKNTTLTSLELSRNRIGCQGAKVLADALRVNTTLTKLDLSCNQISTKGLQALADALSVNTTLTSLDLTGNQVGEVGCKALSYGLRCNESLTHLNFGYNQVHKEGCQSLVHALCFNESLTWLDLRGNQIGTEGCEILSLILFQNKTLMNLNLSNNHIGNDGCIAFADALAKNYNSRLSSLDLSCNEICSRGSTALANALHKNSTMLTSLDLGKNKITSTGWQAWVSIFVSPDSSSNMTLECIAGDMDKDIKSHLDQTEYLQLKRHLRLNRAGRYSLLKCSNSHSCVREKWVEALVVVKDDVISLFYLLSRKPELCMM